MNIARVLAIKNNEILILKNSEKIYGNFKKLCSPISAGDIISFSIRKKENGIFFEDINILKKYKAKKNFPPPKSDFFRFHEKGSILYKNIILRSKILFLIRKFFLDQNFIEVETPIIATTPGLETHILALKVDIPIAEQKILTRFLLPSPEFYMKRLLSAGFEKIFQICHAFRPGETGRFHEPEFTILEWYRAGVDYNFLMKDTEDLIFYLVQNIFNQPFIEYQGKKIILTPPWDRKTFKEIMSIYGGIENLKGIKEEKILKILVSKVERNLGTKKPLIVYEYPSKMASLAKIKETNKEVCERFEVYIAGIEIANGFTELIDETEQRRRFKEDIKKRRKKGLEVYPMDYDFLDALKTGLPPCAGIALGVDRLLMLFCNSESIDKVISFSFRASKNENL